MTHELATGSEYMKEFHRPNLEAWGGQAWPEHCSDKPRATRSHVARREDVGVTGVGRSASRGERTSAPRKEGKPLLNPTCLRSLTP